MKYVYIENGIVREVFQVNPHTLFNAAYASQFIEAPDEVQQGWIDTDGTLTAPPVVVLPVVIPQSVTMRQARLALLGAGLLAGIDAAINGLPSPQKEAARIEWEYSREVQRHNGFVSVLAPMLGLTEAQIDSLFVEAAKL